MLTPLTDESLCAIIIEAVKPLEVLDISYMEVTDLKTPTILVSISTDEKTLETLVCNAIGTRLAKVGDSVGKAIILVNWGENE